MVRIKYLTVGLIVVLVSIFIYFHYFRGDEAEIKERFRILAEAGQMDRKDTRFDVMKRVSTAKSCFAESFEMNAPRKVETKKYDKKDLNTLAIAVFSRYAELSVQFHDLMVSINKDRTAHVILTAEMSGEASDGQKIVDFHELECVLKKVDGEWLIVGVEFVDVLEK